MWGDQWVPQHKNYDFHPLMAPWGLILGDLIAGSPLSFRAPVVDAICIYSSKNSPQNMSQTMADLEFSGSVFCTVPLDPAQCGAIQFLDRDTLPEFVVKEKTFSSILF
jgi:hypothetical protein